MGRFLLLLMLLGLPASVRATLAYVSVEELVQKSDLIVVGTLREVSEHTADGVDYGEGRIHVREVIWGGASPGAALLLKWDNPSDLMCPRIEHKYTAGKEGIWLLTRAGAVAVAADYPGRFVEASRRGEVEALLRRSSVLLRSNGYLARAGEPLKFAVVYRNGSDSPREFPGVALEGGRPRLTRGARLTVVTSSPEGPKPAKLAGGFATDVSLGPVTVGPRDEFRVEFDLRDLLESAPKEGDSYSLKLKLPGLPATNEVRFYLGGPGAPRAEEVPPPAAPTPACAYKFSEPVRRVPSPAARAALAALAALLLFPIFRRLRAAMITARLARVLHGAQTWQI